MKSFRLGCRQRSLWTTVLGAAAKQCVQRREEAQRGVSVKRFLSVLFSPLWVISIGSGTLLVTGCGNRGGSDCLTREVGCLCSPTSECAEGLDCVSNSCVQPVESALEVNASDARACELVVRDGQSRVTGVSFADSAQGTEIRRGARTAITFVAREDRALAAPASLRTVGETRQLDVTVEQSRCFDRGGNEIAGSSVSIGG